MLKLVTGLVCPPYLCRFNDFFETTQYNRPDVVMPAPWKQMAEFCRADRTPTTPEPPGTTIRVPILHWEQTETAQNDIIEFMQNFETNNDNKNLTDAPNIPMHAFEGDTPTDQANPDASTSSHGEQHEMSWAMANSVSQFIAIE